MQSLQISFAELYFLMSTQKDGTIKFYFEKKGIK